MAESLVDGEQAGKEMMDVLKKTGKIGMDVAKKMAQQVGSGSHMQQNTQGKGAAQNQGRGR